MDFKGQPVINATELGLLALNPSINYVVGTTPEVLTPPSDIRAGVLVLSADNGDFRARLGNFPGLTFTDSEVNETDDEITITDHGLETGSGPFYITSDDTLPDGLTADTPYWVVVLDDDTIQLADTYAHAIAETPVVVDFADAGAGNMILDGINPVKMPTTSDSSGGGGWLISGGKQIALACGKSTSYALTVRGFSDTDVLAYYWL